MAATRQATGNSKPRVVEKVEASLAAPKKKRAAPKKASGTKTKANTSAPRSKKVSTDKVTKKTAAPKKKTTATTKKAPVKKAPATKKAATTAKKATTAVKKAAAPKAAPKVEPKHEPSVLDTVNGALLTLQGKLLGRPGKKVSVILLRACLHALQRALASLEITRTDLPFFRLPALPRFEARTTRKSQSRADLFRPSCSPGNQSSPLAVSSVY